MNSIAQDLKQRYYLIKKAKKHSHSTLMEMTEDQPDAAVSDKTHPFEPSLQHAGIKSEQTTGKSWSAKNNRKNELKNCKQNAHFVSHVSQQAWEFFLLKLFSREKGLFSLGATQFKL